MSRTILVPLDRSEIAESVLPAAATLAGARGATLRLLHVAPEPGAVTQDGAVIAYENQEADRLRAEAEDYLLGAAASVPGVPVDPVVRFGNPAREILAEAEASGADLIALATHGHGGLRRLVMGSVAAAVTREAPCEVLMVRPRLPAAAHVTPASELPVVPEREALAETRCLICANPSKAGICPACEARIRGEALERKRKDEAAGRLRERARCDAWRGWWDSRWRWGRSRRPHGPSC